MVQSAEAKARSPGTREWGWYLLSSGAGGSRVILGYIILGSSVSSDRPCTTLQMEMKREILIITYILLGPLLIYAI